MFVLLVNLTIKKHWRGQCRLLIIIHNWLALVPRCPTVYVFAFRMYTYDLILILILYTYKEEYYMYNYIYLKSVCQL